MTSDRQIEANRVNARNSTGPRTEAGKSKAAGNALRHGLTSAPPPDLVRGWLMVILDTADLPPLTTLSETERGRKALRLAMAEARLRFLSMQSVRGAAEAEEPDTIYKWHTVLVEDCDFFTSPLKVVRQLIRTRIREHERSVVKMGRLQKRYLREAQSARNRAFAAWVNLLNDGCLTEPALVGRGGC